MGQRDQAVQASLECKADFDGGPHATVLLDMRNVEFKREQLAPIVLALSEIPSFGCSIALLASQKTYHIACMISVLAGASRKNVGVFRSAVEASDWLLARQGFPAKSNSQLHKTAAYIISGLTRLPSERGISDLLTQVLRTRKAEEAVKKCYMHRFSQNVLAARSPSDRVHITI